MPNPVGQVILTLDDAGGLQVGLAGVLQDDLNALRALGLAVQAVVDRMAAEAAEHAALIKPAPDLLVPRPAPVDISSLRV